MRIKDRDGTTLRSGFGTPSPAIATLSGGPSARELILESFDSNAGCSRGGDEELSKRVTYVPDRRLLDHYSKPCNDSGPAMTTSR